MCCSEGQIVCFVCSIRYVCVCVCVCVCDVRVYFFLLVCYVLGSEVSECLFCFFYDMTGIELSDCLVCL